MKIILTEKIPTLGDVGEVVNVKAGYARNFLIPNRKAIIADLGNQAQLKHIDKMLARKVDESRNVAESIQKELEGLELNLIKKAGASGKLFGAVTTNELSKELAGKGIQVERRSLSLDQPIKALGSYQVKAKLFKGVEAAFSVKIEADPAYAEELKKKAILAEKKKKEDAKRVAVEAEAQAQAAQGEKDSKGDSPQELSEEERLKKEAAELLKS